MRFLLVLGVVRRHMFVTLTAEPSRLDSDDVSASQAGSFKSVHSQKYLYNHTYIFRIPNCRGFLFNLLFLYCLDGINSDVVPVGSNNKTLNNSITFQLI